MSTTTETTQVLFLTPSQLQALIAVHFAADSESSRYALAAVRLEIRAGMITAIATDGRRLAYRELQIDHSLGDCNVMIPLKTARELRRKVSTSAKLLRLVIDDQSTAVDCKWNVKSKARCVSFAQVEGRFPEWRRIIPETSAARGIIRATVSENESDTVDCWDFTCEKNGAVRIESRPRRARILDNVEFTPLAPKSARAARKQIAFTVDHSYLQQWIDSVSGQVEIRAVDSASALHCLSESINYILMPLAQS